MFDVIMLTLHIKLSEKLQNAFIQFVKFGIVGLSNTGISYLINIILLVAMRRFAVSWDYIAANIGAFLLGTLWSFFWNNKFVFKAEDGQTRNLRKTIFKTYVTYGFTGIILNNALSFIWINIFGISKYIAPLFNLIISVPANFFISKLWTFNAR
jgi:putative flippase GtrA